MMSASALAKYGAIANKGLPDTCVVQRATVTSDGQGGRTKTWATAGTYACRYSEDRNAAREEVTPSGIKALSMWRITFPAGTDVDEKDRVVVSGQTFEVDGGGPHSYEVARVVKAHKVTT